MKRILSIVLTIALIFSLSANSFAATTGLLNGVAPGGAAPSVSLATGSKLVGGVNSFTVTVPNGALNIDTAVTDPIDNSAVKDYLRAYENGAPLTGKFTALVSAADTNGVTLTVTPVDAAAAYTALTFNLVDGTDNASEFSAPPIALTVNPNLKETITYWPALTGTTPATLYIGSSFVLSVPKSSFSVTATGNGTVEYPTTVVGVPNTLNAVVSDGGTTINVTFTANAAAGTTTVPSTIKFTGDTTSQGYSLPAINIRNNAPESIATYPAFPTAAGTYPTSMTVGDTFRLTFAKTAFGLTATGNGTRPASYLSLPITGVPSGLSAAASEDTNYVYVTFTAVSAITTVAGTIKFTSDANPASAIPSIAISSAVIPVKPTEMTKGLDTNYSAVNKDGLADYGNLTVYAGDKIYMPLTGDMFGGNTKSGLTEANLRSAKLTLRLSSGNTKLLESYKIVNGTFTINGVSVKTAAVEIAFIDPFRSTKDQDFKLTVYPVLDGKRLDQYSIVLDGSMVIRSADDLDSDSDYVELRGVYVAEPTQYIKLVECDFGEGVSVWSKLYANKAYWGMADTEPTDADDTVFAKYPSIDQVIHLDNIGFTDASSYVTLDGYSGYYVYDANMKYLGKSTDKLAYSSKYYLSTTELQQVNDVTDDDDQPLDAPVPDDLLNPTPNKNANPGTGR